MRAHASVEDLMGVLEGQGARHALSHLDGCAQCRARLEHAREGLLAGRDVDVPEPSPLYWEAFRRQVSRRISADERALGWWRLGPALIAAALLVALVSVLPFRIHGPGASPVPQTLPAWSALPALEDDGGLSVLEAMTPSAEDLGPAAACGAGECLAELSDEESLAVAGALRDELAGGEAQGRVL